MKDTYIPLEQFPKCTTYNKIQLSDNKFYPLYILYKDVQFTKLNTFDLLRLLHSMRLYFSNVYEYYDDLCYSEICNCYDVIELFNFKHSCKYQKALKFELSKREHVSNHVKKSAIKCQIPRNIN